MDWYKHDAKAFNQGTAHMSLTERGAYITLLNVQWDREGYLPSDESAVMRLAGAFTDDEKEAVRSVLEQKFTLTEAGYVNERMLETVRKAQEVVAKKRRAGKASGRARAKTRDGTRVRTSDETEGGGTRARARRASVSDSSSNSTSASEGEKRSGEEGGWSGFQRFFDAYPKKVKVIPARQAWVDMEPERPSTDEVVAAVEAQVDSGQLNGGRYTPDPATWLRNAQWADEIVASDDNDNTPAKPIPVGEGLCQCSECGTTMVRDRLIDHIEREHAA